MTLALLVQDIAVSSLVKLKLPVFSEINLVAILSTLTYIETFKLSPSIDQEKTD